MNSAMPVRCDQAFDQLCVHANGDVVCSIIDGRGSFVLGSVHRQSLGEILDGARARELRRLVLESPGSYCPAIGKRCPLKRVAIEPGEAPAPAIRVLAIEPTTACDLRCLACPVRDFSNRVTWRDAYRDGGLSFLAWDGARRVKQHFADALLGAFPTTRAAQPPGRYRALLLRGRIPASRNGTLPAHVIQRVVAEAGPAVEHVDLFSYGEPFLYGDLVEVLRGIRRTLPDAVISISTNGLHVGAPVEEAIVSERLLDWWIFSIDGCDAHSYDRYRIGGNYDVAMANLVRVHGRATPAGIHVIWQYVVFHWNDRDEQLKAAIDKAKHLGIPIWFDFTRTFGRSRRTAKGLEYVVPHLRPLTTLPS